MGMRRCWPAVGTDHSVPASSQRCTVLTEMPNAKAASFGESRRLFFILLVYKSGGQIVKLFYMSSLSPEQWNGYVRAWVRGSNLASLRGARRANSRLACRAIIYSDDIKNKEMQRTCIPLLLISSDMRKPPQEQCRQDEQRRQ